MKTKIFGLAAALTVISQSVFSAPMVYTSEADWLAALGGAAVVTETFDSSSTSPLSTGTTDLGLLDIIITGNPTSNQVIGSGDLELQGNLGVAGADSITFDDFDIAGMNAFAGDWKSTTSGALLTVTINGMLIEFDNYLTDPNSPGYGFLGFIDFAGISSMTFGVENILASEIFTLDDARMASANRTAAVPLPSPLALLAIGLMTLVANQRKHRAL